MKKIIGILAALLVAVPALAATASFTGNMEQVQTVTGLYAWKCEYFYNGETFWRLFKTSCPGTIEVE